MASKVLFDSQAAVSVVHKKWLANTDYKVMSAGSRQYQNASGGLMGTGQLATFNLHLSGASRPIKVEEALVVDDEVQEDLVLLGQPELTKYGIDLIFSEKKVKSRCLNLNIESPENINVVRPSPVRVISKNEKLNKDKLNSAKSQKTNFGKDKLSNKSKLNPNSYGNRLWNFKRNLSQLPEKPNSLKNSESSFASNEAVLAKKLDATAKIASKHLLDGKAAYLRARELDHQKRANEYTYDDASFDESFISKHPTLKSEVLNIFKENKQVFRNVIGKVPDMFAINGEIKGEFTPQRQSQTKRSIEEEEAITKKLDQELADGVLAFPEDHNITVKNFIPLMSVHKKDDEGRILPFSQGLRIVNDCKRRLNKITSFAAMEIDNLKTILSKAATASQHKFKCKFDISNAFYQVPVAKSLWQYFGVHHPKIGQLVYTRLSQGWVSSFGWATNVFLRIFNQFTSFMFRYMDDVYISAPTKDLFLERLDKVLKTCAYYGLTLKGSKFKLFEEKMNFLGHLIQDGQIHPSPHHVLKAKQTKIKDIQKITDLRTYLGFCRFLAKHMRRSTDVFGNLQKLVGLDGNTIIDWDKDEGFLRKEFDKTKKALNELTELTPFDRLKQAYILVDSSKLGTGAILYQQDSNGINRVIEFYSRKRPDSERKRSLSSCLLETAGMVGALAFWRRYLQDQDLPVIVFTDSASLVKVAARFARNEVPSDIGLINKCFSHIEGIQVQVRHLAGKSDPIQGVDIMSRLTNLPDCSNDCDICKLAGIPSETPKQFVQKVSVNGFIARVTAFNKKMYQIFKVSEEPLDEYLNHAILSANPDDPHLAVIETYPENPFELTEAICPIMSKEDTSDLKSLLSNHWALREAQAKERHLRTTANMIKKGENCGPRQMRINTLMNVKKAYLDNGVLKYKKHIGLDTFEIIPLPVSFANKAIAAVHKSYGCRSQTQLIQLVKRHFDIPNTKVFVDQITKNCYKCMLLKKDNMRPKNELKKIPVPKEIGEAIYVDEICRTDRFKKELKIFFATEGLSRFAYVQIFQKPCTADKFVQFMAGARAVLSPLQRSEVKVTCRSDGASVHSGKDTKERLKKLGVEIEIFQSSTVSKNVIPEHDARIGNFSKFLNVALNHPTMSNEQAVLWATLQYNQSLSNLNWSAAEIFTGRRLGSQDLTNVQLEDLRERIRLAREKSQQGTQKANLRKNLRKEVQLVPYKDDSLNVKEINGKELIRFKVGDVVKLNLKHDKNNLDKAYIVLEINWQTRKFIAQKLNKARGKKFTFDFSLVDSVISEKIRKISEQALWKRKIFNHFLLLQNGTNDWEESAHTISEREIRNELIPKKFEDSGYIAKSPFVKEVSDNPSTPLLQPSSVKQTQNPTWVPATPETPFTDSTVNSEDNSENNFENKLDTITENAENSDEFHTALIDSENEISTFHSKDLNSTNNTLEVNSRTKNSELFDQTPTEGSLDRLIVKSPPKNISPPAFASTPCKNKINPQSSNSKFPSSKIPHHLLKNPNVHLQEVQRTQSEQNSDNENSQARQSQRLRGKKIDYKGFY